jgi:hypothetical protein
MDTSRKSFLAVCGRLFSCVLFGCGLFLLKWSPVLVLLGFWMEEVLQLASMSLKSAILSRRYPDKGYSSPAAGTILLFFPVVHLIFVLIFTFMSKDSPESRAISDMVARYFSGGGIWLDRSILLSLLEILAALLFWTLADFLSTMVLSKQKPSQATLDKEAKTALVLPHFSLIVGGFCLTVLDIGPWLAAALVASKCLFELFLLPAMDREAGGPEGSR